MSLRIKIGVSNRHIHLCKRDLEILFGDNYELNKRNDLTQTGEYACEETVIIKTDNYEFPHVRVLGPLRDYTQVEVSLSDSRLLGIDPPMRDSGDLEDSESVWIVGPVGSIYKKNCCIRANRHIHCNKLDNIGHTSNDIVTGILDNGTKLEDIHIKENDNYVLELHIDRDDAEEYVVKNGDYITIE